jgi:hypothetical protein
MGVLLAMIGRPDTTDVVKHDATAARSDAVLADARKVGRHAWRVRRVIAGYIAQDGAIDARRRRHW